jgi:DNA mismatch repair protein MutL
MLSCPGHAAPASGGDTVQGLYEALLTTMKNGRILGQNGRFAQLEPVIRRSFDFRVIGLPTLNRAAPRDQYLVVNGRPVRDKLLVGAVRGAYQDVLARDRHPMVALFVDGPAEEIDVNVHPAKAEVRFRDAASVRGLIVGALRNALAAAGHRASSTVAAGVVAAFRPGSGIPASNTPRFAFPPPTPSLALAESANNFLRPTEEAPATEARLGTPRAQLHRTYILAETPTGIVLVDQHAAHERLVYERMKEALAAQGVARQALLLPEIVELDETGAARLAARTEELAEFGLVLEPFGPGAVVVREVPALLPGLDVGALMRDLADELAEWGDTLALKERIETVCGTLACHTSVRAGRHLSPPEMMMTGRQRQCSTTAIWRQKPESTSSR